MINLSLAKFTKASGGGRYKKASRKSPNTPTALAKSNARKINKMRFNATERAEFMVQHEANDVVEPYQYTQLLAPFVWQGIFRMDARSQLSDSAATLKTPQFRVQHREN